MQGLKVLENNNYISPLSHIVMITATIITFLLLFVSSRAETQVAPGTSLSPTNDPWLSNSGFYRQGSSGFAVGIWLVGKNTNNMRVVLWTANRDDPPVTSNAKLEFTMNGTLVLADQGKQKPIVNAIASASSASMLDSGNFVLYHNSSSSNIIWQSFDHPTDTLLGGQILPVGGQLCSSLSDTNRTTGRYNLKMQPDGNLVLYPAHTDADASEAYWASDTNSGIKQQLYLNKTGVLQIRYSSNLRVTKELAVDDQNAVNHTIYRATLDFDGVFRMYAHRVNNASEHVIENFPDGSTCKVKGFCGYNSYCTFNDDNPVCNCLEGYKFIDANEETLGCVRNYSKAESCGGVKYNAFYNMTTMKNIKWEDFPYSVVHDLSSEDECSSACFADCNCWAALFVNATCEKQGMPLRYVKRELKEGSSDSTTAFIKKSPQKQRNRAENNNAKLRFKRKRKNEKFARYFLVRCFFSSSQLCSPLLRLC